MYTCITPLPYGERTANSARQPRGRDGRDALLLRAKVTACAIASFLFFSCQMTRKRRKSWNDERKINEGLVSCLEVCSTSSNIWCCQHIQGAECTVVCVCVVGGVQFIDV